MSFFSNARDWPNVPLIDIATLKRGYDLPVHCREEGDVPIYAANGQNGTHSEVKVGGPGVVTGRSGTIGKVHYVEEGYWPLNTALYVTDFNGNYPKWVYYMLQAFKLNRFSEGAGVPTLNRNLVHGEIIPLPPITEQKRIAAILDKADALRRKRQQAIDLADQFLRSVFLELFGDPVMNPMGWEIHSIGTQCTDIVDCVNRTAPIVDYVTPYKMIRTTNVRNSKLSLNNLRCVEKDIYEKWIRRLKPVKGDIIFTREAPAGEAAIVDTEELIFLGQRTMHFRPDIDKVTPEYLLFELMSSGVKTQIRKMHAGSTVTHLSVPECKRFDIRIPPIGIQRRFSEIYRKILINSKSNEHLFAEGNNLFSSLSQKAFAGEL